MVTVIMEDVHQIFGYAESINVYNDGKSVTYGAGDRQYKEIMRCWNAMIEGAHQMPAFGVSLNGMTTEAMKKNLWMEFDFGKVYECGGMPFEKLLVQVEKNFSGFNLVRYMREAGYEGRCFYLDLVNKNMTDLFNLLQNIT